MKKAVSLFLSFLMLLTVCGGFANTAHAAESGSFTALCYNVAGLPDIGFITGSEPDYQIPGIDYEV